MEFNFNNESPIYIQLVDKLKESIISGEYPLGSKIPSVRDLAFIAKVNPNTIQKALGELEREELIYTERTNGKYVTEDKELINKIKTYIARDITEKYITNMSKIGITNKEILSYLEEIGGIK